MLPHAEPQLPPPPQQPERTVDLLDDLPTEALDKILSSVPARDVVRTSVLSQPWRHRWESVPGLVVELHDVRHGAWGSAVSFLERCAGPVGRVSIRGVPLIVCHRADDWVRLVAGKSPRSLSLALPKSKRTVLPSIFRCDPAALAELELRSCWIPAPPAGFAGFQRLTKLDLDDVKFAGLPRQLEAMVSAAAPTLVELRLQSILFPRWIEEGSFLGRCVIQAPNLRRLVLCLSILSTWCVWELGPLPNLECARIFLDNPSVDRDYLQMFTAISNVRELHIGNFGRNKQAAAINTFKGLLWRFENLRILRLDGNIYKSPANNLSSLCPSLETIEFKEWY